MSASAYEREEKLGKKPENERDFSREKKPSAAPARELSTPSDAAIRPEKKPSEVQAGKLPAPSDHAIPLEKEPSAAPAEGTCALSGPSIPEEKRPADERAEAVLRAACGDEDAFRLAVELNLPLVAHIAKRFDRAEAEYEDLFQTGCIGLMKAIRRYEPGFGTAFSTYAVPVIMGEMRRLLRDGGQVHVARSIRERAALIAKTEEAFLGETGRSPTFQELSERLGLTREEIALSYGAKRPLISLDAPAPGMENVTNGEMIAGAEEGGVEEGIVMRQLMRDLAPEDRRLIELRYHAGKTQTETGAILGMTQVQVCRREKKLLRAMREASGGI